MNNKNENIVKIGAGILLLYLLGSAGKSKGGIQSKYYTIEDVQRSNTAVKNNITEQFQPLNAQTLNNVNAFIRDVLDPLTDKLGEKLDIESWWRSVALNNYVGGVPDSFHLLGLGIDADAVQNGVIDNRRLVKAMYKYDIPFTEMVLYGSPSKPSQIHLAYDPNDPVQKQLLLKTDSGYQTLNANSVMTTYGNVVV